VKQRTLVAVPQETAVPEPAESGPAAPPRLCRPERHQMEWRPMELDALVPEDHWVRAVWAYVEGLDLGPLYERIKAVEGHAGRPPIDPRVLLALWLQATLDGIGSARRLDELSEHHAVYQWIRGGVSVNYHTLADFRAGHAELLDALLTRSVGTLMHQGLVRLERVAQDGLRVRGSAGLSSVRKRAKLEACLGEAREQVERLRRELDEDPAKGSRRERAARERAVREREERVRRALEEQAQLAAGREGRKKGSGERARASTTDPEARVMKMPDGGCRPGYNVQLATDTGTQVIVGVDVTNVGSDGGQLAPMVEQIEDRHGERPEAMLADGSYATHEDIEAVSGEGKTLVYAPVKAPRNADQDPHAPRRWDTAAVAEWRVRMGTPEAKAIYRERAATAECVNAIARTRGLRQVLVRGLRKVRAVVLWYALAHNLRRLFALAPAALGLG